MKRHGPSCLDSPNGCVSPLVSVVICTKGRAGALERCVDSVLGLAYDGYEVVVVDNSTRPQVESLAGSDSRVRHVWESKPGSGFARAAGVYHSRGEIIAMTDDDCVVDGAWLRWLVSGFGDQGVMCCTGHVTALELLTPAQLILETYSSYSKGEAPRLFGGSSSPGAYLSPQEVGTGANMAFRRSVFGSVGSFDPALGAGTPAAGGEELDIFSRILRRGGQVAYEPRAVVKHDHPRDYRQLRRTFFKYGTGYNAFMTKVLLTGDKRDALNAAFGRTLFWYRWAKQSVKCRLLALPHMPLDLQSAYLLGSLCGPIGYLRSRRRAQRLLASEGQALRNVGLAGEGGG